MPKRSALTAMGLEAAALVPHFGAVTGKGSS